MSLKSDNNNGQFTWRPTRIYDMLAYDYIFAELFLELELFLTKPYDITTHIECLVLFFLRKSCLLWHNVERYGTARQAKMTI
jgi:hypothetical protein